MAVTNIVYTNDNYLDRIIYNIISNILKRGKRG